MTKNIRYGQLDRLINAYFHQDWSDDHDDETAVLADFARSNWQDDVQSAIEQIDRYLAGHPAGLLDSFVSDFNPMITLGTDDAEAKAWLERARDYLSRQLSNSPVRPGTQSAS